MVCNLSRCISGLVLFVLGAWSASQPATAADLDVKPYGGYTLAANPSDKVKEVIEYDNHSHVSKDMIIPAWGVNKGLKITAYYPGSKKMRMTATGEWSDTIATYYRPNGTRDSVLTIANAVTIVAWYDKSGTTVLFKQYWFKTDTDQYTDGWLSPAKHNYKLWDVEQMDRHGNPLREYTLYGANKVPDFVTQYSVKCPGDSLMFMYRQDGTLERKTYRRTSKSEVTREEHTAAEGIAAPHVPTNLLKMSSHLDEDDFPKSLSIYDHGY